MARRKTAFSSFQAVGKDLRRFSAEEQFYPAVKLSSHIKAVIHFGKMIKKKKKKTVHKFMAFTHVEERKGSI